MSTLLLLLALGALARGAARARPREDGLPALIAALGQLPAPARLADAIDRILPWRGRVDRTHARATLARARLWAGAGLASVFVFVIGPVSAAILAPALLLCGAGLVDLQVAVGLRRRRAAIRAALPDCLDILAISARSGVAIGPGLAQAVACCGPELGGEIQRTLEGVELGQSWPRAYSGLVSRCGVEEVAQLAATLARADELGTPPAEALADLADSMRRAERDRIRERAARAAPKIQLIVALVMVPGAVTLVLGVLVLELVRQVGGVIE